MIMYMYMLNNTTCVALVFLYSHIFHLTFFLPNYPEQQNRALPNYFQFMAGKTERGGLTIILQLATLLQK